jgi:benzodiazapine receptor
MNRDKLEKFNTIVFFFFAQLTLNLLWPSVFNSANYFLSLVMISFMIVFSVLYAYLTFKPLPNASKLVWPYIVWITFAAIINIAYYLHFR